MRAALFSTGFLSLLAQIVLLRELAVVACGNELTYVFGMGAWLALSGLGALGAERVRLRDALVPLVFGLAAILVPAALAVARELRALLGALPGSHLPLEHQALGAVLVLAPVGLVLGAAFHLPAKLHVQRGGTLAGAYAIESAGGLAGGVAATALIAAGIPNLGAALLCVAVAALALARAGPSRSPRLTQGLALTLAAATLAALPFADLLDHRLAARHQPALLATRDSAYGRLTVTRRLGQLALYVNGALAFESEDDGAEAFVDLALVQRPAVERILVLGGGLAGLTEAARRYRPTAVDDVELDARLVELVLPELPPRSREALTQAPVRLVTADPRRYLETAGEYDLILVGMPEPESGQANRFYTEEFFRSCAAHLGPGGVLALRLRGAENLWTPAPTRKLASVAAALRASFADVVALPATPLVLLASNAPLSRDPGVLGARLARASTPGRLVSVPYLRYLYENDRYAETARRLASAVEPNTDARPVSFHYALLDFVARLSPELAALDPRAWLGELTLASGHVLGAAAVAAALLVLVRRFGHGRRLALATLAGLAGMVFESTLILAYQVKHGVLFQDLGLLLTTFMAGLATGAWALDRLRRALPEPRPGAAAHPRARLAVAALVLAFAIASAGLARLTATGFDAPLLASLLLLAGGGFFVGVAFAHASATRWPGDVELVGTLYGADLVGGAVGALAAGLVLIPAAGLAVAFAVAAFAAVAILALV